MNEKIELLLGGGRDGHLPTPNPTPRFWVAITARHPAGTRAQGLSQCGGNALVFLPTWEPVCGVGKDRPPSLGPSWGSSSLRNSRVLSRCYKRPQGWDTALSPSPRHAPKRKTVPTQQLNPSHRLLCAHPCTPPSWDGGRLSPPSHRHGLKLWLLLNPEPEADSPRVPGTREPDPRGQEHK